MLIRLEKSYDSNAGLQFVDCGQRLFSLVDQCQVIVNWAVIGC